MPDQQPRRPTATAWNVPFRVAARLPERDAACATGGGRQAACAGCISSSSTRRRSAPSSHLHLSRDSGHWLSLFVCVSAQVMYGASAASRHFGGVVLWRLDPLAAGEVLIRAGEHIRGCCTGLAHDHARIRRTSSDKPYTSTFAHAYHNTRSDPDAGADGCAEGSEGRPCAGAVILWERALLAWGMKISHAESSKTRRGT